MSLVRLKGFLPLAKRFSSIVRPMATSNQQMEHEDSDNSAYLTKGKADK
jgi:hypothetical protein